MSKAIITVDLGWGDAGKGTIVDALVRKYHSTLVVRFSGGSQCGHNVVTDDGIHHEFAQFGSGTLAEARTLLSKHVLVNPLDLALEAEVLLPHVGPSLFTNMYIDGRALVTTPFHVALNRIKENARTKRHGSCGKGIRETVVFDQKEPPYSIKVRDLLEPSTLRFKLQFMRDSLYRKAVAVSQNKFEFSELLNIFRWDLDELVSHYVNSSDWFEICSPEKVKELLLSETNLIFEASQGILLDQDYGFRPHITKSTCTTKNAHQMLDEFGFAGTRFTLGIARTFMSKHGAGPFPTEDKDLTPLLQDIYNKFNPWQQDFRVGYLDIPALKYAVEANGGIDGLAITHVDVLDKQDIWKVGLAYQREDLSQFELRPSGQGRQWQESLTKELEQVKCNSVYVQGKRIPSLISSALNVPIEILSSGPKSGNKTFVGELTA